MEIQLNNLREIGIPTKTLGDLSHPVVLQQDGHPIGVLISIEKYEQYQQLVEAKEPISAREAMRAANRIVFGDLVGCPLSCGDPILAPKPKPRWRIPYRLFDGTLMHLVEVDAFSSEVFLSTQEREALLNKVKQHATSSHVSTSYDSTVAA